MYLCYNSLNIGWEGVALNAQLIQQLLLDWYSAHYRPLPWRDAPTPYRIWVSEIMLQQTRIEAVVPYYQRFVATLPSVQALAQAAPETLLKLWEGLGYYSRIHNMQRAALQMMETYGGELPPEYDSLLALPGIGEYTAGAIASIAFQQPVPAVDGNVMRVLARLSADSTDVLSTAGKKRFTDLAWELVPERDPGRFNQALMELGETVCTPRNPRCDQCPICGQCAAHSSGLTDQLPVRIKKLKRRIEHRRIALVRMDGSAPSVLLHKRASTGLLANLWELPNTEDADSMSAIPVALHAHCTALGPLPQSKHLFSHIEWRMSGELYSLPFSDYALGECYCFADLDALRHVYALPSAFRTYAKLFPELLDKEC